MSTTSLWVLVVVLPAFAAALLVLLLDLRGGRRRLRPLPAPSRLTALLGASLGAGGFGLASLAGLGPTAHAAHGPEQVWVATATSSGEGVRALGLVDPAAIVAAANAAGILPRNGVYTLVLRTPDPPAGVVFTLAAPPAPAPAPAASNGIPPITGASASAVIRRPSAAAPASAAPATAPPGVIGIPGTGGGAPLIGGLAMLLAGGACAGASLSLRRARGI